MKGDVYSFEMLIRKIPFERSIGYRISSLSRYEEKEVPDWKGDQNINRTMLETKCK